MKQKATTPDIHTILQSERTLISIYPCPRLKVTEARETVPGVDSGFVFDVF